MPDELPILEFHDAGDWARWLAEHHASATGIWMKIAKKNAPRTTAGYPDALEEALCFGWIDGQKRSFDEHFWLQRFTPRTRRSRWSEINRAKAEELIAAGRMQAAGHAEVEAARADGRWEAAYPSQQNAGVPEDLQAALDQHPAAREFFAGLAGAQRYAFLHRLHHVKGAAARQRRIAHYIELLSARKTLVPDS